MGEETTPRAATVVASQTTECLDRDGDCVNAAILPKNKKLHADVQQDSAKSIMSMV